MTKKLYEVRESQIHGKGLFARTPIKIGDVIGSIKYKRAKKDGPYVLWLSENEGIQVSCDLKYINHNPKPNACYYDDLNVVALKNIKTGEEITHDYGDDWH